MQKRERERESEFIDKCICVNNVMVFKFRFVAFAEIWVLVDKTNRTYKFRIRQIKQINLELKKQNKSVDKRGRRGLEVDHRIAAREVRGSNPAVSLLRGEKDEIDRSRLDRMDGWMRARVKTRVRARVADRRDQLSGSDREGTKKEEDDIFQTKEYFGLHTLNGQ